MASRTLWIIKKVAEKQHRKMVLAKLRNQFIRSLVKDGYSYGEIEQVVRINKGSISRLMRFGKNISRPVA